MRYGSPADTWLSFDARVLFYLVHQELVAAMREYGMLSGFRDASGGGGGYHRMILQSG